MVEQSMIGENVRKITVHKALSCELNDTVIDIAQKLKESKERRIFVSDSKGKLNGIITATDLVYKSLAPGKTSLKAKDVMVTPVKSVNVTEDLEKALEIMNSLKTFTCPVTDNGKLIGVLSYHDLVNYVFDNLRK